MKKLTLVMFSAALLAGCATGARKTACTTYPPCPGAAPKPAEIAFLPAFRGSVTGIRS